MYVCMIQIEIEKREKWMFGVGTDTNQMREKIDFQIATYKIKEHEIFIVHL